jgi:tetratricopeptide (TPR) repeat protein
LIRGWLGRADPTPPGEPPAGSASQIDWVAADGHVTSMALIDMKRFSLASKPGQPAQPAERLTGLENRLLEAQQHGGRQDEIDCLGAIGRTLLELGDEQQAREYHEHQLAFARMLTDRGREGDALAGLAAVCTVLGDFQHALEHGQQALAIAREMADRDMQARIGWNLGLVYLRRRQPQLALPLMQAAAEYEREIGHADAVPDNARVDQIRASLKGGNKE